MEARPTTALAVVATPSATSDVAPARDDNTPSPAVRNRYEVVSVERAPVPDGGQGTDWCRYVLSCGTSRITGLHRGTLDEVTAFAAACVEEFNLRSAPRKGKAPVVQPRKR